MSVTGHRREKADGFRDRFADIADTIHAHPTLNKAVQYAFEDVSQSL